MSEAVDVYIVDDDASIRDSLGWVFEESTIKSKAFGSGDEFLRAMYPDMSGCLVLDLSMPGMSGVDVIRTLRAHGQSHLRVIVVTGSRDLHSAVQCMKLGATDVLEKPLDPSVLVDRVRSVLQHIGERSSYEAELLSVRKCFQQVSSREKQLLTLICQGFSNKQLASKLNISAKTVANHRAHIIRKMGAENTADLVRKAMLVASN